MSSSSSSSSSSPSRRRQRKPSREKDETAIKLQAEHEDKKNVEKSVDDGVAGGVSRFGARPKCAPTSRAIDACDAEGDGKAEAVRGRLSSDADISQKRSPKPSPTRSPKRSPKRSLTRSPKRSPTRSARRSPKRKRSPRRSPTRSQTRSRTRSRKRSGERSRRRRKRSRSRSRSNRRRRRRGRSKSYEDKRPPAERSKGGVKLFVGRLPREVKERDLRLCFEEYGRVLEVVIIVAQALSGVVCAFVRMASLDEAKAAMKELHEQRMLIPGQSLGPMQVAFAKGEALRLGLDGKEEILPSLKDSRKNVEDQKEKKQFFENLQKQQRHTRKDFEKQQQVYLQAANASLLSNSELISLVKDGQRQGGSAFRHKWRYFCDQGWQGSFDYDPSRHRHESLSLFVSMANFEHGSEDWFRRPFEKLPAPKIPPPPIPPPPPPFGPGPMGVMPMLGGPFFGNAVMPPVGLPSVEFGNPQLHRRRRSRSHQNHKKAVLIDDEPSTDLGKAKEKDVSVETGTPAVLMGRSMNDYADLF